MIVKPMKISPFCLLALKKANKMLAVKAMSKIPNLLYSTRYSSYNGPAPAALGAELMKAELFNILETLSLQWSSFLPLLTTQQWLWADAQLMPEQGAAESHLGHKVGSLFSYKFPWSWSRQNGQNVTGNQERHRMNTASHQLCFYSKAGPTAECMEKGHPKSKCAGRNHRHKGHSLILYSYLVSSCRQKGRGVSKKRVFSSSAHCTAWWLNGFQTIHLLVSKAHFEMPDPRSTGTSTDRKSPGSFCLRGCVLHCMPKAKFLLHTTFAKSVHQAVAEQKDFAWFEILFIRYSGTLF